VLLELDDIVADSVVVTDTLELELRDNVSVKLGLAYTVVLGDVDSVKLGLDDPVADTVVL
jgi:hypothetical protein